MDFGFTVDPVLFAVSTITLRVFLAPGRSEPGKKEKPGKWKTGRPSG